MDFKQYLITENTNFLGQKVGDILTASQELRDDSENMGTKDLVAFSKRIVSQIRRILHSEWNKEDRKYLKVLQKVGVAIMKSIDDKNDIVGTIASATAELEKLTSKIGVPLHKLSGEDTAQPSDKAGVSAAEKGKKKPKEKINIQDKQEDSTVAPGQNSPSTTQFNAPLGNSGPPSGEFKQ